MRWSTGIVLIVDHEDGVLEILRTALQSTDYILLQAKSGDEALAVLSRLKAPIDLAIIHLDLPYDDGLAVGLLTILGRRAFMKIIIKTSRQDKPFLEQVNHIGIDAVILKPISEEQFIKTVQSILSGRLKGSTEVSAGTTESACDALPLPNGMGIDTPSVFPTAL